MIGILHFIPWHTLAWLAVPASVLAAALVFAPAPTAAVLKAVPAKAWIILIVALVAIVYHSGAVDYAQEAGRAAGVASMQAKVDAANLRATQAEAANHGAAATIANLQMSQAQCESGRIADQAAAARALAGHDQAAALIHAQLVDAKAKVQALFDKEKNPTCAAWAEQPACTP